MPANLAKEETQKEIENYGGNGPGQNSADEAGGRRAGNLDALGGKLTRDRRINPDGNKFGFAVRPWLLKRAFDYILVNDDRGDLFASHELLELAIGNRIGLPRNVPVLV